MRRILGKEKAKDGTYYIVLKISAHDMDRDKFGDYLLPVYLSEEEMIKNHPGTPFITVHQKDNRLLLMARGIDDDNI